MKPWHIFRGPSQSVERLKRWFVYTPATPGLPTASSPKVVNYVSPVLSSRPPRQTEKAAKCPEPLCPTRVLPPLGRRDPSPERTLLLRLRSYRLIRRSRWALSSFGFWPRLESPCRLLPVPAAHGSFPTLSPTVCSWMLDPLPRRYTVCSHLFLPRCHRPSPEEKWVGFPQLSRLKRLRAGGFSRLQIFRYVPASKFARPPDRPYRCEYSRRAAGAFTSEQNAVRYLPAHRIC